ncbi:hypothetical protein PN498_11720 [Oscillatoria sp. CS-180]|uniref:hypothetical protein n=1 Tax=Oscillatoria sp. CS-180 TaxID=3021720 RepID=UPI002330A22D|nr:hypothetical protein [Oscillatoria sp. CS-180]MDB9526661.1 hypothetical protein [Oscillatoria sp. CS-180]
MSRLNNQAYEILAREVERLVQDPLEGVRRDIILRRLNRLRQQDGPPLTYAQIKAELEDIFPEFDDNVLRRAARVNQRTGRWGVIRNTALGLAITAGGIWVLNLPYPMIRWPVSRTVPIVLLPSFLSMDHHYRQATSLVEQADQLVNQATSAQDIELGADRAQQAQKSLDKLPVWFLGYYPRTYCSLWNCSWRFTYDEFETARKDIGRIEAKVFQEDNALDLLEQGTAAVETAKQQYQSATETPVKLDAAAAWQTGLDMLNEIPSETLAGRMAATRLEAYQRDFNQVSGLLAGGSRTSTLIDAAKQFAWTASEEAQNPPHSAETWERITGLWQQAIARLEQVPVEDAGYNEAQRMLAEYQNKLGVIQEQLVKEQRSRQALESAQQKNIELADRVQNLDAARYAGALQSIVNDLNRVEPGTTAYEPAQQLLAAVQERLRAAAAAQQ